MGTVFRLQFLLQLLAGEGLFLLRMERKRWFPLRLAISLSILAGATALLPGQTDAPLRTSVLYLGLFAGTLAAMALCFLEPFQNLLLAGIAGYTIQHISYLAFTLLDTTLFQEISRLGVPVIDPYAPRTQSAQMSLSQRLLWFGIYVVIYYTIFFLLYLLTFDRFDPLIQRSHSLRLGRTGLLLLSGLLITADIVTNMLTMTYTEAGSLSHLLELGYNLLVCTLVLELLYHQLLEQITGEELMNQRSLREQGNQQYELLRKSSELINIKYHDLRHRSEQGRERMSAPEREELEQVLSDYDSLIVTGNKTLDVILTEQNIQCRARHIQLFCMADGRGAAHLKPHHLNALISNAVGNAMEAVEQLPEDERIINLYWDRQGSLQHFRVENPFRGKLHMRGGFPLSSKPGQGWHGYGLLSIRQVAEQYGGAVTVTPEEGVFVLDVVIPDSN